MALEEVSVVDQIEVLLDGVIQIRRRDQILKDGVEVAATFDRNDGTSFFPNHISSGGAQNFQNTMINNPTTINFGYRFNCTYYTD